MESFNTFTSSTNAEEQSIYEPNECRELSVEDQALQSTVHPIVKNENVNEDSSINAANEDRTAKRFLLENKKSDSAPTFPEKVSTNKDFDALMTRNRGNAEISFVRGKCTTVYVMIKYPEHQKYRDMTAFFDCTCVSNSIALLRFYNISCTVTVDEAFGIR
jgi:hypothetical protein